MTEEVQEPVGYRYSIIPGRAPTDNRLKGRDLQVLCLLGRHTKRNGWCIRSQVEMARELDVGRATIGRSIDRLMEFGYLERKATGRGRAKPDENKQPFSSFWYRVKIDEDTDDAAQRRVPINGHPRVDAAGETIDVPKAGQGVPTQDGHGVPKHERAPLEGSSQGIIPNPSAREGVVASLGQGEVDRWPEFRSAVANTWPGGFPADNEIACKAEFGRQTRLHLADLLLACARQHGRAKTEQNAKRSSSQGTIAMRLPSNWLKDGDWQGYIPAAEKALEAEVAQSLALGRVTAALGAGVVEILRRRGMSDDAIARLEGMTRDDGPPPILTCTSFQAKLIDRHTRALENALGEGLIVMASGHTKRSA